MKIFAVLFISLSLFAGNDLLAQDKTIILLRHAEKDISPSANKDDPELTTEGRQRAEKLVDILKKYKPEQIFSTPYKRARFTAVPLAESIKPDYRVQIQAYDFEYLDEFAAQILKSNAKCIVVVGHNTTTPMLANALIGRQKYGALGDSEYNKIFIIRIKGKKVTDKVIEY